VFLRLVLWGSLMRVVVRDLFMTKTPKNLSDRLLSYHDFPIIIALFSSPFGLL
jgi:hypothetical protein